MMIYGNATDEEYAQSMRGTAPLRPSGVGLAGTARRIAPQRPDAAVVPPKHDPSGSGFRKDHAQTKR